MYLASCIPTLSSQFSDLLKRNAVIALVPSRFRRLIEYCRGVRIGTDGNVLLLLAAATSTCIFGTFEKGRLQSRLFLLLLLLLFLCGDTRRAEGVWT